jgi:uncharacterized phage infection (PIP) family protein YhgE
MTTPLLNRLLEEAVDRCQALATEAQDAVTASGQVAEEALELAKLVEQEGQDLHEEMTKVIAAVQDAATQVTAAAAGAIATLESVPGRARESTVGIEGVLAALRREAVRLDAAREQLFEGLRTAVGALNEDFTDLVDGVDEYLARVAKAFHTAGLEVHKLPDHAVELGQLLSHRMAETRKDVEQLGATAEEHAAELVRAIDYSSQTISDQVTTLLNEAIGRHDEVMTDVRAGVLDETPAGVADPSWIEDSLAWVKSEIANLDALPDQVEEGLFPPLSAVAGAAGRAASHLETTADSLAKVVGR